MISLHALTGVDSATTMHIKAYVINTRVIFLIDCGSSSNFIDVGVVKKMGFTLTEVKGIEVMVANGEKLEVNYIYVSGC